jgi:hypothetical protein
VDLPQVVIPVIIYDIVMAGLSTAVFYVILTMVFNFWRERTSKERNRP